MHKLACCPERILFIFILFLNHVYFVFYDIEIYKKKATKTAATARAMKKNSKDQYISMEDAMDSKCI